MSSRDQSMSQEPLLAPGMLRVTSWRPLCRAGSTARSWTTASRAPRMPNHFSDNSIPQAVTKLCSRCTGG